jgi:hypothetical protein
MYPSAGSAVTESGEVPLSPSPNRWKWFLMAVLWIVAALFLLATTGAQGQSAASSRGLARNTGESRPVLLCRTVGTPGCQTLRSFACMGDDHRGL